jgi:hypothetical protein
MFKLIFAACLLVFCVPALAVQSPPNCVPDCNQTYPNHTPPATWACCIHSCTVGTCNPACPQLPLYCAAPPIKPPATEVCAVTASGH